MNQFNAIFQSIIDGDEEQTVQLCQDILAKGCRPIDILEKGMIPAMDRLGVLLNREERFIPQVLISARAMQSAVVIIRPLLLNKAESGTARETVIVGTVQGDIHTIGKTWWNYAPERRLRRGGPGLQRQPRGVHPADTRT